MQSNKVNCAFRAVLLGGVIGLAGGVWLLATYQAIMFEGKGDPITLGNILWCVEYIFRPYKELRLILLLFGLFIFGGLSGYIIYLFVNKLPLWILITISGIIGIILSELALLFREFYTYGEISGEIKLYLLFCSNYFFVTAIPGLICSIILVWFIWMFYREGKS